MLDGSWVIKDTTIYDQRSITYQLKTPGLVRTFNIKSLHNEKNPVVAFYIDMSVGFDPNGINNPACKLKEIAASWYTCDFGLSGTILTLRAHKTFFEMFNISVFSNSQIDIDLKN